MTALSVGELQPESKPVASPHLMMGPAEVLAMTGLFSPSAREQRQENRLKRSRSYQFLREAQRRRTALKVKEALDAEREQQG